MHDDDMRHVHNVSDWRGVADEIEIELVEKCRTDRVRGNDIEERAASVPILPPAPGLFSMMNR